MIFLENKANEEVAFDLIIIASNRDFLEREEEKNVPLYFFVLVHFCFNVFIFFQER